MTSLESLLARTRVASPLPFDLNVEHALRLDLSEHNRALDGFDPGDTAAFSAHIEREMAKAGARYAAGGYGENRTLYQMSPVFRSAESEPRTLHLGIDLWLAAGTAIHAVLAGRLHSSQDNAAFGDYGPTLIFEHELEGERFHTLYGHLARRSLAGLSAGQQVKAGERIGWLGEPAENVGWPAHLHFQVIRDLEGKSGDYPGVARPSEAGRWLANCPDPNLLLRIRALA